MAVASVGLLGPIEAWSVDGTVLHLGPLRQRALLAVLALHANSPVNPELLIEAAWGDRSSARARQQLHTYISRLRRALQPEALRWRRDGLLRRTGDGYVLSLDSDALDVTRFEQLFERAQAAATSGDWEAAMALFDESLRCWRGQPVAGLSTAALDAERHRLEERRLSACQGRLGVALRLGRHEAAAAELPALVAQDPFREPMVELLMLAQYRCGRQAEALRTYAATRQRLVEDLGVEPGADLQRLHLQILCQDPQLDSWHQRDTATPAGGPSSRAGNHLPVPQQLPPDVADFVGRATEIGQLTQVLAGSGLGHGLRCVTIAGPGGVGKSALAVHFAHRVRGQFPDGQLYVDLRGTDRRPEDPFDVLASFLRMLGVAPDAVPESFTERALLYRSLLSDRRLLVLLDNARDEQQISGLVPGSAQCAVIATGRARLELAGTSTIALDPLPVSDAVDFVAAIVGDERVAQEPDATRLLVDACGRLPLAVRIAATRLAARSAWTISSMCARLERCGRLNELALAHTSVRACFQLSYQQLTPAAARAFRLLSVVATPDISVAAAAASLGSSVEATDRLLESLVDDALLSSPAPGRYVYHDLLQLFAQELAATDGPQASLVVDRWFAYYTHTAIAADRMVRPTMLRELANAVPDELPGVFADPQGAAQWVNTELAGLAAAVSTKSTSSASIAADVLEIIGDWLLANGRWEETTRAAGSLLHAALRDGDSRAEACARRLLGYVSGRQRRPADANKHFALGLAAARRSGSVVREAHMLSTAACTDAESQRYNQAISRYARARQLFKVGGFRRGEVMVIADLAFAHLKRGDLDAALGHARQGIHMNRQLGDTEIEALCLDVLGAATEASGRSAESATPLSEALMLCRSIQLRYAEAHVLTALARVHHSWGDAARAATMCEEALAIRIDLKYVPEQAETLSELGRIFADQGETARAASCRQRADQLSGPHRPVARARQG